MATTGGKGQDGQSQNRIRGTLESDCAVVAAPPPTTTAFGYHPNDPGVVRQNLGFSYMDVSAVDKDRLTEPMKNVTSDKPTSTTLQDLTQTSCNLCISTAPSTALSPNAVEHGHSLGLTAGSSESEDLETQIRRLRMENEPCENGDT